MNGTPHSTHDVLPLGTRVRVSPATGPAYYGVITGYDDHLSKYQVDRSFYTEGSVALSTAKAEPTFDVWVFRDAVSADEARWTAVDRRGGMALWYAWGWIDGNATTDLTLNDGFAFQREYQVAAERYYLGEVGYLPSILDAWRTYLDARRSTSVD